MSQDAREQARHIIEVIKAFADGKVVREKHRSFPKSAWKNYHISEEAPLWNFEVFEYEVKPEERKPREWWEIIYCPASRLTSGVRYSSREKAEERQETYEYGPDAEIVHVREVLPSENTGGQDD